MPKTTTMAAIAMSEGWIMTCLSARNKSRYGPLLARVAELGEPKRHFYAPRRQHFQGSSGPFGEKFPEPAFDLVPRLGEAAVKVFGRKGGI